MKVGGIAIWLDVDVGVDRVAWPCREDLCQ